MEEFRCFCVLRHPRIIQYLGYFESIDYYNLILEYAPHGTLKRKINQRAGRLDYWEETHVVDLFVDMVRGVLYLHDHLMIHRDLRPENIMYDIKRRLKITGLSKTVIRRK